MITIILKTLQLFYKFIFLCTDLIEIQFHLIVALLELSQILYHSVLLSAEHSYDFILVFL